MGGWYMMGFGWVIPLIFLVLIIYIFTNAGKREDNEKVEDSPKKILKERFARGEIDEETFKRRMKMIEGENHAT